MNHELPNVQAGFRKSRGTRDQIANIRWIIKKARDFQKNIYFCFIDYAKAFDCVYHNKLWKILKEMGIPDYLTCLSRNLYSGQEATVRTGHGELEEQGREARSGRFAAAISSASGLWIFCRASHSAMLRQSIRRFTTSVIRRSHYKEGPGKNIPFSVENK